MFSGASSFNQDLSQWDMSSVTDMSFMFDATPFNQDISHWNTSSTRSMTYMFRSATYFNQNISKWDTSSVTNMQAMFQSASSFNQDLSQWDISSVTDMKYMFAHAKSFNQDLSAWKDDFPYEAASVIFVNSGCTYKDTPTNSSSKFCSDGHKSLFDQVLGKSITSSCSIDDAPSLMCSASTDATVPGGILKTYLVVGGCPAQNGTSIDGPNKSVDLIEWGACIFKHCFRADYFVDNTSVLANMTEIDSIVTYKKNGSFSVEIQTAAFVPSIASLDSNASIAISASLGECGMDPQTAVLEIGETAVVCVSVIDNGITLSLKSVEANPGGYVLVDSAGVPNFITTVLNDETNQVTLKTLMIPAYYDAQNGNSGSITISGTALVSYTSRHLSDEHVIGGREDSPFTIEVPLRLAENPDLSHQTIEEEANEGHVRYSFIAAVSAVGAIMTF
ncbi:hypothetical protein ACHAW6_006347 [Cyclotella cf. meneghiniana]